MSMKTQGTHFYLIDENASGGAEVVKIECVLSADGLSAARDDIETTCLEDSTKTYEAGMPTPGEMTIGLNFDINSDSHTLLQHLHTTGEKFDIAIGLSDGTTDPDLDTSDMFDLPTNRSFITTTSVYVKDFPFNFALNSVITTNVVFKLSDFVTPHKKSS